MSSAGIHLLRISLTWTAVGITLPWMIASVFVSVQAAQSFTSCCGVFVVDICRSALAVAEILERLTIVSAEMALVAVWSVSVGLAVDRLLCIS